LIAGLKHVNKAARDFRGFASLVLQPLLNWTHLCTGKASFTEDEPFKRQ